MEDVFVKGQEALLHLCVENKKLVVELKKVSSRTDISSKMMELATNSLKQMAKFTRIRDEEVA